MTVCVIAPKKCIESHKSDGDKELKLNSVPPLPPPYYCDCPVSKFVFHLFIIFLVFAVVVSVLQNEHERCGNIVTSYFFVCFGF